jgi:integrase
VPGRDGSQSLWPAAHCSEWRPASYPEWTLWALEDGFEVIELGDLTAHLPGDHGRPRAPGPPGTADGRRLDRHGAGRIVRKVARRAGIGKAVTPHTLRHAFITVALDAGVPLRDVQEAASHAEPRTTMRCDRARGSLDRHATYIVAAYVAGAAR